MLTMFHFININFNEVQAWRCHFKNHIRVDEFISNDAIVNEISEVTTIIYTTVFSIL